MFVFFFERMSSRTQKIDGKNPNFAKNIGKNTKKATKKELHPPHLTDKGWTPNFLSVNELPGHREDGSARRV